LLPFYRKVSERYGIIIKKISYCRVSKGFRLTLGVQACPAAGPLNQIANRVLLRFVQHADGRKMA
jgi:hypothetical protein